MPCPECKAEDRLCIKNGFVYRKTTIIDGTAGARVQRYQCTKCGHHFTSQEMDAAKTAMEKNFDTTLLVPPCACGGDAGGSADKCAGCEKQDSPRTLTGVVSTIIIESDRILLGVAGVPDYYVIADANAAVAVGDTIEYNGEGVNFGWFVAVTAKGDANVTEH